MNLLRLNPARAGKLCTASFGCRPSGLAFLSGIFGRFFRGLVLLPVLLSNLEAQQPVPSNLDSGRPDAILEIQRGTNFLGCFIDWKIYINNQVVGSVGNGAFKKIVFEPSQNGTNTIYITTSGVDALLGTRSLEHQFDAGPDALVRAECGLNFANTNATMRSRLNDALLLKVDVEKQGAVLGGAPDWSVDTTLNEREISSEVIETLPGTKRTVRRSMDFEREVRLTHTLGASATLRADSRWLVAGLAAEVCARLEKTTGRSIKQTERVEQIVEIDGEKAPRVKLMWVEQYRKGSVNMNLDGIETNLPFEFRENLELKMKLLK